MKKRKTITARTKLSSLLKDAAAFEHVPVEQTPYDRIQKRVGDAITELNAALDEAHKCAEMRVFIGATERSAEHPMQFQPQIYRLTYSTLTMKIMLPDEKPVMQWRQIKDPRFVDAAGRGLGALQKSNAQGVPGKS